MKNGKWNFFAALLRLISAGIDLIDRHFSAVIDLIERHWPF